MHIVLPHVQIAFLNFTSCDNQDLVGCISIPAVAIPLNLKNSQSSHKMYSNNIVNLQESTTILNACTKSLETYWMHHVSYTGHSLSYTGHPLGGSYISAEMKFVIFYSPSRLALVFLIWDRFWGRLKYDNKVSSFFFSDKVSDFFLMWTHRHFFILSETFVERLTTLSTH